MSQCSVVSIFYITIAALGAPSWWSRPVVAIFENLISRGCSNMKILVWMMEGPACEATLVLGVAASNQSLLLASSRVIGVVVSWFENCISLIVRVELFSSTAKNFHDMEDTSFSPCAWLFLFEKWAKLNAAFSYCERDIMREKVLAMRLKLSLIGEKKEKKKPGDRCVLIATLRVWDDGNFLRRVCLWLSSARCWRSLRKFGSPAAAVAVCCDAVWIQRSKNREQFWLIDWDSESNILLR